jgi:hypothetical protein
MTVPRFDPWASVGGSGRAYRACRAYPDPSASTKSTIRTPVTADLDAFDERVAIIEFDSGLSRERAEKLAAAAQGFSDASRLRLAAVCRLVEEIDRAMERERDPVGLKALSAARRFCSGGWVTQALALGWTELDLFAVSAPERWSPVSMLGAAYSAAGPAAITRESITTDTGERLFRRSLSRSATLPWEPAEKPNHEDLCTQDESQERQVR